MDEASTRHTFITYYSEYIWYIVLIYRIDRYIDIDVCIVYSYFTLLCIVNKYNSLQFTYTNKC